jgi:large-conductance mechanosensitive channel
MIKTFEKLQNIRKREGDTEAESALASDEVVLLTEIRDLLRERPVGRQTE